MMLVTRHETDKIVVVRNLKIASENRHQSISQSDHLYHVVLAHDVFRGHSETEAKPVALHGR